MRSSILMLTAAGAAAGAITTDTADLFFPGVIEGQQAFYAMSLGQDSTATTYLLGCRAELAAEAGDSQFRQDALELVCGQGMPLTMTQGPKTVSFERAIAFNAHDEDYKGGQGDMLTQDLQCALSGTTSAACTMTFDGPGMPQFTSYIGHQYAAYTHVEETLTGTDAVSVFIRVPLVTDGASILNFSSGRAVETETGTGAAPKKTVAVGGTYTSGGGGFYTGNFVIVPSAEETSSSAKDIPNLSTPLAELVTSAMEVSSSTAAASASDAASLEGAAGRIMGLGGWMAAMIAGIVGVASL